MVEENKKNPKDTTVIACHCYQDDIDEFKKLCREQGKFHSEVLRELILNFNKQNRKPQKDDIFDDIDSETEKQPPFVIDSQTGKIERKRRVL